MSKKKFECPVCGSKEYKEKRKNNGLFGPDGISWIDHYTCMGCSVKFENLEKFSKKDKTKSAEL